MSDLAGQTHTAIMHSNGDISIVTTTPSRTSRKMARRGLLREKVTIRCQLIRIPSRVPCSLRACRRLAQDFKEHIRKILHDFNGRCGSSWTAFQFSYHIARNRIMVTLRPGLNACTGQVTMMRVLSLLLGWRDRETLLLGCGNTCHMAPSQPRWDPVESLLVHCDLTAEAHVVGNIRNYLLCTLPREDRYGQAMCYVPRWLDWLPMLPIWRRDVLRQAAAQAKRQLLLDLKTSRSWHHHHHQHHHNSLNNTLVASSIP